jgi:hypothetical protein
MTRREAIALARRCARRRRERYVPVDTENFEPDEWIIDAIIAAADHERAPSI